MTTRKQPQDHKPPTPRFTDVPGADLLRPITQVKGSDQARLTARLQATGLLAGDTATAQDLALDALADFIDYVGANYATDPTAFDAFTSGPGGMERAITLTLAYAGEMGKGGS